MCVGCAAGSANPSQIWRAQWRPQSVPTNLPRLNPTTPQTPFWVESFKPSSFVPVSEPPHEGAVVSCLTGSPPLPNPHGWNTLIPCWHTLGTNLGSGGAPSRVPGSLLYPHTLPPQVPCTPNPPPWKAVFRLAVSQETLSAYVPPPPPPPPLLKPPPRPLPPK